MAQNPLQQYFRQPKVFIGIPSHGIYSKAGTFDGDISRIPVCGMTGMDEIIMKTPDALLSGESTVSVIASCCSAIRDPWELTVLDIDLVLIAIRIATFGNELTVSHICPECDTENDYDINLTSLIDYFASCKYDNKLVLKDLAILTRPLTYRESTEFSLKNFEYQQKLKQIVELTDQAERQSLTNSVFRDLALLKNEIFTAGIESVDTGKTVVSEKSFIREWVENCDSSIIDAVTKHIEKNQSTWAIPKQHIKCSNCGHETDITLDLDQASFFANA